MRPGTYQIKEGNTVVAYAKVTPVGTTWTPREVKGNTLSELQKSLENGKLPEGFTAKEMNVETGFNREKPNWKELTPSTWKRNRWLQARGKV